MPTTTFTTTAGGKWVECIGGMRPNYCAVCHEFTTGPTWQWYPAARPTVCTATVCDSCARAEA